MTKVISTTSSDMLRQSIKAALNEALFEAGIKSDMVSLKKASELLSKHYVMQGIQEGKIRITTKRLRNSKQLIPVSDIIKYKEELLEKGTLKLKR
jgi:hypothetical protein